MALLVESVCGLLRYKVFDTREAMGACAGSEVAAKLKELLREKEEVNVMFAAAPSQNETLQTLMADTEIEWERVNGFHMDEYVGLDENHPAGFRNFLKNAVFSKKNFKSVNLINGNADDPEKEADVIALTLDQEVYDEYIEDAENHEDARTEDGITAYSEEDGTKDYFFEVGDGSGAFFMISVVNQDEDADAAMSRIAVEATGWTGGDEEVQAS